MDISNNVLTQLAESATRFADIVTKEASGIRDGDGSWHGSDAFEYAIAEGLPRIQQLVAAYQEEERSIFHGLDAGLTDTL